jgi:NAD(P)-dependent dehydrogenase (short-subunit alcohol dehydrogenase family)
VLHPGDSFSELIRLVRENDKQIFALVDKTVAAFGKLDAAFNNAGIQNVLADAADQTMEDFERVIGVNLRDVWSCMKYELRQMRKQSNGTIVNCSSIGGILGGPQRGTYPAKRFEHPEEIASSVL